MVGHSSDRNHVAQAPSGDSVTRALDGEEPGLIVAEAVGELTGRDPVDLPPIERSVDTDALAALCTGSGDGARIAFEYESHAVVIEGGTVRVGETA